MRVGGVNDRRDNVLAGKRKERKQWEATTKAKPLTDKKKGNNNGLRSLCAEETRSANKQ